MQAVILAGGMGTRLRGVIGDHLPKPLAPVAGRPMLERQLEELSKSGICNVLLLTGYAGDQIQEFCGDGSKWKMKLCCLREQTPRGTAGAVLSALEHLEDRFLVLYGDTVFDFDAGRMLKFHLAHNADATIFLHPNDHPYDSDLVEVDEQGCVTRFHPYPHAEDADLPNLVNAGIYILERAALTGLQTSGTLPAKPDFGKHVFSQMLAQGKRIAGYRSPEYVKDAGTPERLEKTSRDLLSGRVAAASLRSPAAAVFLDRDGTLIEERGYISSPDQVSLFKDSGEALIRLNRSNYRTVMVSNQPVVARGEATEEQLQKIHNRLETLLGREHAYLDALYYCPHHPDSGFAGERKDLKILCCCRKPATGMLMRASQALNVKLADSWMIGDTTIDVMTAKRAGVRSVLLSTGEAGRDGKWPCLPDYECASLSEAVGLILNRWPRLIQKAQPLAKEIAPGSVVLVGGLARSGKSSFAAALADVLRGNGRPAAVVPMDCWLRGEDEPRGSSVLDRYDVDAVLEFVRTAQTGEALCRAPRYDRKLRRSIPNAIEFNLQPDSILIVEGVPALAYPELRALASHLFYVRREEQQRLTTMRENYRWRGWSEERIDALVAERQSDELPLIEPTREFAHTIVEEIV